MKKVVLVGIVSLVFIGCQQSTEDKIQGVYDDLAKQQRSSNA